MFAGMKWINVGITTHYYYGVGFGSQQDSPFAAAAAAASEPRCSATAGSRINNSNNNGIAFAFSSTLNTAKTASSPSSLPGRTVWMGVGGGYMGRTLGGCCKLHCCKLKVDSLILQGEKENNRLKKTF